MSDNIPQSCQRSMIGEKLWLWDEFDYDDFIMMDLIENYYHCNN